MGVPDLRGGLGTSTFYTSDPAVHAGGEREPDPARGRRRDLRTHLIGPRHPKTRADLEQPTARSDPTGRGVSCVAGDRGRRRAFRRAGRWSDWLRVSSRSGCSRRSAGWCGSTWSGSSRTSSSTPRRSTSTPRPPALPDQLAGGLRPGAGRADRALLHDRDGRGPRRPEQRAVRRGGLPRPVRQASGRARAMLLHELERQRDGLFFCLFDTPDRVQHMFWRFLEPDHPANRARSGRRRSTRDRGALPAGDAVVGRVLERPTTRRWSSSSATTASTASGAAST